MIEKEGKKKKRERKNELSRIYQDFVFDTSGTVKKL
jgi:DNA-directed RNA polymerase delta subunit